MSNLMMTAFRMGCRDVPSRLAKSRIEEMTRLFALTLTVLCGSLLFAADKKGDDKVGPALQFKMKSIDGQEVDLAQFQGKVVMFVNVASQCGLTPQYEALEKLYEKYMNAGFVIVGVPANEFGNQEPGTDAEIKEFCSTKYNVKFPMMSKVVVKGKGITPLYQYLTEQGPEKFRGPITWNFEKFLVNRQGEVIARFAPRVRPDDPKVIAAIEEALKK
jgi:glutathione peroxidase